MHNVCIMPAQAASPLVRGGAIGEELTPSVGLSGQLLADSLAGSVSLRKQRAAD